MVRMIRLDRLIILYVAVMLAGCVSLDRRSQNFDAVLPSLKNIAVMPPYVKVYKLSAGGISEEIDEWSVQAAGNIENSLKKYLGDGSKYHLNLKFVTGDWIKANQKNPWRQQKALYEAVVISVLRHTYGELERFPQKMANFDYSLGKDVNALAQAIGVDGFIFVNASDTQETAGHIATSFVRAMILGYYEIHPSFFSISLIDGKAGDLVWFNVSAGSVDYNFLSPKHIDSIVQCVTQDFIASKK